MNLYLKYYLLHLRDILHLMPYLSLSITLPLFYKWLASFRFNMTSSVQVFRKKKHRFILDYLEKRYSGLIATSLFLNDKKEDDKKLPIWVFWYQGEENMPPLVKLCYESIKRNACGRRVHLLDKNNMLSFVDIPDYILKMKDTRNINMANFADILRLLLLAEFGGSWLDATLFVTKPLSEEGLNPFFTSIKMPALKEGTISDYRWSTFCLYAHPGASTICCFRDILLAYFRDGHKRVIDYLLIDYIFQMMYEKCDAFRRLIDNQPRSSEYTYTLVNVLNEPYDADLFDKWREQQIFKLNWRLELKEGDTMFHYLENKYINQQ